MPSLLSTFFPGSAETLVVHGGHDGSIDAATARSHLLLPSALARSNVPVSAAANAAVATARWRHLHHALPTLFADQDQAADDSSDNVGVECDFNQMQLGNQPGQWKTDKPSIKYAYDNNLKGQEISVYWIGKTTKGECNDLDDDGRHCWYRAKMINDIGCSADARCLHFAPHDGMNRHNYTCPTWVRDAEGAQCKLPEGWQACPRKFTLKRVDSGIPQEFKGAVAKQCPGQDEGKQAEGKIKKQMSKLGDEKAEEQFEQAITDMGNKAMEAEGEPPDENAVATSNLQVSATSFEVKSTLAANKSGMVTSHTDTLAETASRLEKEIAQAFKDEAAAHQSELTHKKDFAEALLPEKGNQQAALTTGTTSDLPSSWKAHLKQAGLGGADDVAWMKEDEKTQTNMLSEPVQKEIKSLTTQEEKPEAPDMKDMKDDLEVQKEVLDKLPPKLRKLGKKIEAEVGLPPDEDNPQMAIEEMNLAYKEETEGAKAFSAPLPQGGCTGSTEGIEGKDINMIMDVHQNSWYRCSQGMRCEQFEIQSIRDGPGECNDEEHSETCGEGEQCFTHKVSSKRVTKECIKTPQVWVISDSDDKAKVELALVQLPPATFALLSFPPRCQPVLCAKSSGPRCRIANSRRHGAFL